MAFNNQKVSFNVPFSSTVTKLSDDQRNQATSGAQLTEVIQNLYSLVLYDTVSDATVVAAGLDPAGRTKNAEYFFRVPPKVMEFDEPFATTVQGTQDGGKYVESYGSIIKALRVSGTTGLRPNKSSSAVIPLLGITDAQLNTVLGGNLNTNQRRIPADEKTGHDDIIFMRNLFRYYSDNKASDNLASRVVMLWRNLKDADYWVVEPDDFKLQQSSNSPLTYEYSMSLKTLSRFDFTYTLPADPLEAARSAERMLARLQEYGQNITNIFLTVSTQINRIQGFATFVSNTVLAPMINVLNGLNAVKTSAFGVVRGLTTQVQTLAENTQTAISKLVNITEPQDSLVRALRRLVITCARILGEPVASESDVKDVSTRVNRYAAAYETQGTTTTARRAPSDSPTYIGYENSENGVGSDLVHTDEDIRDVAERLLGDRARWRILVVLNRLRAPFISPTGGPGILMPGDSVLYPTSTRSNVVVGTQKPSNTQTENSAQSMNTPVQQAYGRDLALRSNVVGDSEITDLVINQRGDLGSIQGIPNVEQAIRIKFMTQRGELPSHPKFGAKFSVGRKATPSSFNELRINTINTLVSDTRITDIDSLQFVAIGDVLALSAKIKLVNTRESLSTSLALRRF